MFCKCLTYYASNLFGKKCIIMFSDLNYFTELSIIHLDENGNASLNLLLCLL